MKASPWVIAIAAVALAVIASTLGRLQYRRAVEFEKQAVLSLAHSRSAQVQVDWLRDKTAALEHDLALQREATARAHDSVAVIDAIHPPDTSCAPNLAARDRVISSQAGEIVTLEGIRGAQAGQINLLQASKDELSRTLAARPKLFPRFVGPSVGVGVFGGLCGLGADGKPRYCVGVGVTVNVFSVRL